MGYVGSGTGEVTFQVNDAQAQTAKYGLGVSEGETSLNVIFTPDNSAPHGTPLMEVTAFDFKPGSNNYDEPFDGTLDYILISANCDYPDGPWYYNGTGCDGRVILNWTTDGTQRNYTGEFWAYGMDAESNPPMSLKFGKFSFVTTGT